MGLTVKTFIFNAFQVNTYVIYHPGGDCLLVDPACYSPREQEELSSFISAQDLTVKYSVNTHCHVDHVLGNAFVFNRYGVRPMIHKDGLFFYDNLESHANTFGFELEQIVDPEEFLGDGQEIVLGDAVMKVLYTPGHADGSISLVHEEGRWIVTGDLLFYSSIGRTDLPSGNIERLLRSVREKIFVYPDDFRIYPGHGASTTIGFERKHNPYL